MTIKKDNVRVSRYGDGSAWIRGELLGKGSYGSVYKATLVDPNSKQYFLPFEMAVKSVEDSVSKSLRKEEEILRSLKGCPYILECFGSETTVGYDGGLYYNLLLQYASGGTLADRIERSSGKGLSEVEVKMHTRSILRGLNHIHRYGYVHCDLKPANILLVGGSNVNEFRATIGDFGLSKRRGSVNHWRGTPIYLSPEAVKYNLQEAPSDIWAVGCIVLEMLTGKRTWTGKKEDIIRRIAESELPKIPKHVSHETMNFLKCCFVENSAHRWTCRLLLDHPFLDDDDDDGSMLLPKSCDVGEFRHDHVSEAALLLPKSCDVFGDYLFNCPSNTTEIKVDYFDAAVAKKAMPEEMYSGDISDRIAQLVLPLLDE